MKKYTVLFPALFCALFFCGCAEEEIHRPPEAVRPAESTGLTEEKEEMIFPESIVCMSDEDMSDEELLSGAFSQLNALAVEWGEVMEEKEIIREFYNQVPVDYYVVEVSYIQIFADGMTLDRLEKYIRYIINL